MRRPGLQILVITLLFFMTATSFAIQSDWVDLIDGNSLDGWVQKGGNANFEVVDGEIVGSTVPNTPNSFLCTEKTYSNFELEYEFLVHPELNSGVQIRSHSVAEYQNGRVHGYQIEIDPSDRAWTAGLYEEGRRGWLKDLRDNPRARYAFKQGDWNHVRVLAIGERIQVWLNGVQAVDHVDSMDASGFVGLQVHGVGKRENKLTVRWRKIRINENPQPDPLYTQIKAQIPEAASMPRDEFTELATSPNPTPDQLSVKNLTLVALMTRAWGDRTASQKLEISSLDDQPVKPAELAQELSRGKYVTLIHSDRITRLTCLEGADSVSGTCHFELPGLLRGKVNYIAGKTGSGWKIKEFSMPAHGILLRWSDGSWRSVEPGRNHVFGDDPEITRLAEGFQFTEGPALGPDGRIYFNDIPNQKTHVFDPETGTTNVYRENTGRANGLFFTPNDALISCEGGNRQVTRRLLGGEQILASKFENKRLNSPNDVILDSLGGMYFTDPRYGNRDDMEMEIEGVYYLNRQRKLFRVVDDIKRPNGIVLSPDEKILYVADTGDNKIWAFDVAGAGKIENKRELFGMGSDGMSMDTRGNVYLTTAGSIIVVSPSGTEVARLKMPENPANCLLVGNALYVTARTGFYRVRTQTEGISY